MAAAARVQPAQEKAHAAELLAAEAARELAERRVADEARAARASQERLRVAQARVAQLEAQADLGRGVLASKQLQVDSYRQLLAGVRGGGSGGGGGAPQDREQRETAETTAAEGETLTARCGLLAVSPQRWQAVGSAPQH